MLRTDVAPGVHRTEDTYTNFYLVEEGGRLTVVGMGYQHERGRARYLVNPGALPVMAALLRNRAFRPAPIGGVRTFRGGTLDVPGSPEVVPTPGHTYGHCALHLPAQARAAGVD